MENATGAAYNQFFLKKNTSINFEHTVDDSNDNMLYSSKLLMNNFLVLAQTHFTSFEALILYFPVMLTPCLP